MKNILTVLVVNFIVLTGVTQARELLELKMESATDTGEQRVRVSVDTSGRVSKNSCFIDNDCGGAKDCKACESKIIGYLSRSEVSRLNSTIKIIESEGVVQAEITKYCFMQPVGYFKYTANNESLLLAEGVKPCGTLLKNNSPHAMELKEFLLYVKLYERLPTSIVKSEVY